MSSCQGVPCLLLLRDDTDVADGTSAQTAVEGYALLPQAFKKDHPKIVEYFSRIHLPVTSKHQDEPVPKRKKAKTSLSLKLFEAELNFSSVETKNAHSTSGLLAFTGVNVAVYCKKGNSTNGQQNEPDCLKRNNLFNCCASKDIHFSEPMDEDGLEEIDNLLSQGAIIKYGHHKGGTILLFATKRRQKAVVELLLKYPPIVEAERCDYFGRPFFVAAKKRFSDIVDLLSNCETRPHNLYDNDEVFNVAWYKKKLDEFSALVRHFGCIGTDSDCLPLFYHRIFMLLINAVCCFYEDFVEFVVSRIFLNTYFNPNFRPGRVAFSVAMFGGIHYNWLKVVRKLIENGAEINQKYEFFHLCWKSYGRRPEQAIYAFRRVFDDKTFQTPLNVAAACGTEAGVKLLIELGADVHPEGPLEETPIYYACIGGNLEAFQVLVTNGADYRNYPEITAYAIEGGSPGILELICREGSFQHCPELMTIAIEGGNPRMVECLLRNRNLLSIDIEALRPLLEEAVAKKKLEVINVLFKFGVQPNSDFPIGCKPSRPHFDDRNHLEALQALLDHTFATKGFVQSIKLSGLLQNKAGYYNPIPHCYCCSADVTSCFHALTRQVIKRQCAGLVSSWEGVRSHLYSREYIDKFQRECEAEIEKLRSERIGSTNWTFFDLLTGDIYLLAHYAKNGQFVRSVRTGDYKNMFPIYASVLNVQFEKGIHRCKLVRRASKLGRYMGERFAWLLTERSINSETLENLMKEIMKYLSNFNLEVLIHEFSPAAGVGVTGED